MKKSVVLLVVLLFCLVNTAMAVPYKVNFQGKLSDSVGTPLEGTQTLTFTLYDAETGGNALWSETQEVSVVGGVYRVLLGDVTPLDPAALAVNDTYLELQVGPAGSEETLSPRQRLASVPYALKAEQVEAAGLPAGGLDEVSNGIITNQHYYVVYSPQYSTWVNIPDNNPNGVTQQLVAPSLGVLEAPLATCIYMNNSDYSGLRGTLTDPDGAEHLLFDDGTLSGVGNTWFCFNITDGAYPVPSLDAWQGRDPTGTWTLKIVDSSFLNNDVDGGFVNWRVFADRYLADSKISVDGDLVVTGEISGNIKNGSVYNEDLYGYIDPAKISGTAVVKSSNAVQSIDGGTLYIDGPNNRIGVGTASPAEKLTVNGSVSADNYKFNTTRSYTVSVKPYGMIDLFDDWNSGVSHYYTTASKSGGYAKLIIDLNAYRPVHSSTIESIDCVVNTGPDATAEISFCANHYGTGGCSWYSDTSDIDKGLGEHTISYSPSVTPYNNYSPSVHINIDFDNNTASYTSRVYGCYIEFQSNYAK